MSQSQSAEKLRRGDPLGFSKLQFAVKYRKIRSGDPLDTKKIRKKSRTVPKKTQRGDPIVSSGFVSYDKNGVTERGDPLHYLKCTPRLPIQYFSSSVKSVQYAYILLSDEKKLSHCNSRAHFLLKCAD